MTRIILSVATFLLSFNTLANSFESAADDTIYRSHAVAKQTAQFSYIEKLAQFFLYSNQVAYLQTPEIRNIENQIQKNISAINAIDYDKNSSQIWDRKTNSKILSSLYKMRSELVEQIAKYSAYKDSVRSTNLHTQTALINSVYLLEDLCEKGVAVTPTNAQLQLPNILRNTHRIEFQYSVDTDSGARAGGVSYSPENPRGSSEVNTFFNVGIAVSAKVGGPVGWSIAAGLTAVRFLYNFEEQKNAERDYATAYLRMTRERAYSENTRTYFKEICRKNLPIFQKIRDLVKTQDLQALVQLHQDLQRKHEVSFQEFEKAKRSNKPDAVPEVIKSLALKGVLHEILSIAILDTLLVTDQELKNSKADLVSLSNYRDYLDSLDTTIMELNRVSYQLGLMEQDRNIMQKLNYEAQVEKEIHNLFLEFDQILAKTLISRFTVTQLSDSSSKPSDWLREYNFFKIKNPTLKVTSLENASKLLTFLENSGAKNVR